jgi:hypothetical protein
MHRRSNAVDWTGAVIIAARRSVIPRRGIIARRSIIPRRARAPVVIMTIPRCSSRDADAEVAGVRLLGQSHKGHCHSEQC